jgi:pentatricopeptide repeat protein
MLCMYTHCAHHYRWQQALDLVHTMECNDVAPDVSTYTAAMTCCNNAKKWQYALQLWEAMKQRVRTTPINSGSTASRPMNSSSRSSSSSSSSYDSSSSSGGSLKFRPRPCVPVVPNVQAYGACIQVRAALF